MKRNDLLALMVLLIRTQYIMEMLMKNSDLRECQKLASIEKKLRRL